MSCKSIKYLQYKSILVVAQMCWGRLSSSIAAGATCLWRAPGAPSARSTSLCGRLPCAGAADSQAPLWSTILSKLSKLRSIRATLHGRIREQCHGQGRHLWPHRFSLWCHWMPKEWDFARAHPSFRAMLSPIHPIGRLAEVGKSAACGDAPALQQLFGTCAPHGLLQSTSMARRAGRSRSRVAGVQDLQLDGQQACVPSRWSCLLRGRGMESHLPLQGCRRAPKEETTPRTFAHWTSWWTAASQPLQGCKGPYQMQKWLPAWRLAYWRVAPDLPPLGRGDGHAAFWKAQHDWHSMGPLQRAQHQWKSSSDACWPALQWRCPTPIQVSHHSSNP